MITISLNDLSFFAHHGYHEEERIVGTEFRMDIQVSLPGDDVIKTIDDTIDYVKVYELASKHMKEPVLLLETLVMQLSEDIVRSDARVKKISIQIIKKNPPIPGFSGNVAVKFEKDY